ncbi:MAG: low molecular weight protein-tyrosine-phosphatase [Burkholderiaceae bacterium]
MGKRDPIAFTQNTRVLFVCMANICRSSMAEGVFRHMVGQAGLDGVVTVASAGTHAFHEGEAPDKRAQLAAQKRGYRIEDQRATKITAELIAQFDLVLAMDWDNHALLQQIAPKSEQHKIQLLMRFASDHESAIIPDPYYGNQGGFEMVLDYIEDACSGLLEVAKRRATQVAAA